MKTQSLNTLCIYFHQDIHHIVRVNKRAQALRQYPDTRIHPHHIAKLKRLNGVERKPLVALGMAGVFTVFKKGAVGFEDMMNASLEGIDQQSSFTFKMQVPLGKR